MSNTIIGNGFSVWSDERICEEILNETEDDTYHMVIDPSDVVTAAYKFKYKL